MCSSSSSCSSSIAWRSIVTRIISPISSQRQHPRSFWCASLCLVTNSRHLVVNLAPLSPSPTYNTIHNYSEFAVGLVLHFPALRTGPSFDRSYIFTSSELVCYFAGPAFDRSCVCSRPTTAPLIGAYHEGARQVRVRYMLCEKFRLSVCYRTRSNSVTCREVANSQWKVVWLETAQLYAVHIVTSEMVEESLMKCVSDGHAFIEASMSLDNLQCLPLTFSSVSRFIMSIRWTVPP